MVLPLIAGECSMGYNGATQKEGDMEYYTTKQASEVMGISPRGVRKHVERGNIPATVISGLMLIKKIEVDRFLKKKTSKPRKVKEVESIDSETTVG